MRTFLRILTVPMILIGLFLIAAVINALASAGGARVGVAIGYVAGAIILFALSVLIWRRTGRAAGTTNPTTPVS